MAALEAMRRDGATVAIAERGVHGSSMLDAERTKASTVAEWTAVRTFLRAALEPRAPVARARVRYLANEGVILEGPRGRVLIDALFGDGLPQYAIVPPASRDSLERAVGHYGGPAVVIVTHAHRDHFDSAAVARYRRHNPAAVVVGPPAPGAAPAPPVDLGWVRIRPLAIPHGPTSRPVGHAAYLVTLGGTTALHLGDTQSDPDTWRGAGVPETGVNLALVPYWYALEKGRLEAAMAVLRARTVVLFHAALEQGESGWAEVSRELRERYPQVRTPLVPGEVVE
jgi:L-ascorbate metabolism protein UlaG (beta-lactamase superfamily)